MANSVESSSLMQNSSIEFQKALQLQKGQEASDLNAMVVNASHMKAVPGRKTDVKDAEWIADLLQHGLLQPSYIPDKDQRELRELVRYRKSPVGERTRELNSLQKMLEGANIKLSGRMRIWG